jgi:lipoprotein-anchoring transpeptidase ErfK/SrfK
MDASVSALSFASAAGSSAPYSLSRARYSFRVPYAKSSRSATSRGVACCRGKTGSGEKARTRWVRTEKRKVRARFSTLFSRQSATFCIDRYVCEARVQRAGRHSRERAARPCVPGHTPFSAGAPFGRTAGRGARRMRRIHDHAANAIRFPIWRGRRGRPPARRAPSSSGARDGRGAGSGVRRDPIASHKRRPAVKPPPQNEHDKRSAELCDKMKSLCAEEAVFRENFTRKKLRGSIFPLDFRRFFLQLLTIQFVRSRLISSFPATSNPLRPRHVE